MSLQGQLGPLKGTESPSGLRGSGGNLSSLKGSGTALGPLRSSGDKLAEIGTVARLSTELIMRNSAENYLKGSTEVCLT